MYQDIIGLSFNQVKERYKDIKMSENLSKVITMTNREDVDTFSNKSDILLFFDAITGELLTLAERTHRDDVAGNVQEAVDAFNMQNTGYRASTSESGDYVDITVVHNRLAMVE